MYQVIKTQTRPNTNIPFFVLRTSGELPEEVKMHFAEKYMITEKHILATENVSDDDGLVLTIITLWSDQASFEEWKNDPICDPMRSLTIDYCNANGITDELVLAGDINL